MNSPLGILDPLGLMLDYPIVAVLVGIAAAFFLARINDRRTRLSAFALLGVLPLTLFLVARMIDGCSGDIAEGLPGSLGLTKDEECWGKYGFGGVMFLTLGMPAWLTSIGVGAVVHWLSERRV